MDVIAKFMRGVQLTGHGASAAMAGPLVEWDVRTLYLKDL